jgi:signal transduction histidine kinase
VASQTESRAPDAPAPAPAPAEPPPGKVTRATSAWTTRRWLWVGTVIALLVLICLGVLASWSLARSEQTTDQLFDHNSPALLDAVRLESALVNQETGIRGYGLTGQRDFLEPYTQGLADEQAALTALRTDIAGDPDAEQQLDNVVAAAESWQRLVATPVAAAPPAAAIKMAAQEADAGKAAFDRVRAVATVEQQHLQTERSVAAASLRDVSTERDVVFAAIGLTVLVLMVLAFEGLRRGVTAPLGQLAEGAARVYGGEFGTPIRTSGPADLRELADGIEAMRRRLVDELAFAEKARALVAVQAEELRRSNTELEQFAYVASHDLQEPLRKVASFCQLLQRRYGGQLDAQADRYIAFAVDGATRMQRLISDLLEFSRVGRLDAQRAEVDLNRLFETAVEPLSLAVEEAGAEIEHDPLPTVPGDPTQLTLLLQNLLSNSLKFHDPKRALRIRLTAEPDGALWRFAFADNGIGIEPEYAERVFAIFQRLHSRDAYPGTGIGLALCRKIVEYHGGTIEIDPDYRPGARVVFTLPGEPTGGSGQERGA